MMTSESILVSKVLRLGQKRVCSISMAFSISLSLTAFRVCLMSALRTVSNNFFSFSFMNSRFFWVEYAILQTEVLHFVRSSCYFLRRSYLNFSKAWFSTCVCMFQYSSVCFLRAFVMSFLNWARSFSKLMLISRGTLVLMPNLDWISKLC